LPCPFPFLIWAVAAVVPAVKANTATTVKSFFLIFNLLSEIPIALERGKARAILVA